jgi:hypothetical protein
VLALANTAYADAVLSAHFKPSADKQAPTGGLSFRTQDDKNYYLALASAPDGWQGQSSEVC